MVEYRRIPQDTAGLSQDTAGHIQRTAGYRRTITRHCRTSLNFTQPCLALAVTAASHCSQSIP